MRVAEMVMLPSPLITVPYVLLRQTPFWGGTLSVFWLRQIEKKAKRGFFKHASSVKVPPGDRGHRKHRFLGFVSQNTARDTLNCDRQPFVLILVVLSARRTLVASCIYQFLRLAYRIGMKMNQERRSTPKETKSARAHCCSWHWLYGMVCTVRGHRL